MAETTNSVSSWPGFVDQVNKTFMLVRDVFGYALPGGVFLAIGLISGQYSLCHVQCLLSPYHLPSWAGFLLVVAACYAVGDVMAAIAYMPISVIKWLQWWPQKKYLYPLANQPADYKTWLDAHAEQVDRLKDHPTEITGDLLAIQLRHRELFNSLDRRETLALMSGSMSVALLAGWFAFYCARLRPATMFLIAGLVVLIQFMTGIPHLRRVRRAIREADALAEAKPPKTPPDFAQLLADLIKAATDALKKLAP